MSYNGNIINTGLNIKNKAIKKFARAKLFINIKKSPVFVMCNNK